MLLYIFTKIGLCTILRFKAHLLPMSTTDIAYSTFIYKTQEQHELLDMAKYLSAVVDHC